MSPKRFILIPAVILLIYLGIYSWNQRTNTLDVVAEHTGLEFVGLILQGTRFVERTIVDTWQQYIDLVDVRSENEELKKQMQALRTKQIMDNEDREELERLRQYFSLPLPEAWRAVSARVLGGKMGANGTLHTMMISNGYLSGALPGTPVMTLRGVLGRVLRAGPLTATVLLIEDPGHRIAVITQKGRVSGMLMGSGVENPLELEMVTQNSQVEVGETLITSGLDGLFPKGLPVGIITSVKPSAASNLLDIDVKPLADLKNAEDILLLERSMADSLSMTLPYVDKL